MLMYHCITFIRMIGLCTRGRVFTFRLGQGSIQFHIQCLLEASSPGVTEMKYLGVKRTTHLHLELKEFMELYLCSSIHFSDIVLY